MNAVSAREWFGEVPGIEVRSNSRAWVCLRIVPELDLKLRVVNFFRGQVLVDLATELNERLCVGLDELLANAMEHGCRAERERYVELEFVRTAHALIFQLRDSGPGFSWSELNHAAVNNPVENPLLHVEYRSKMGLRPGGYGIMLVKQIADELVYNEQGNAVLFVKYI
jgi:two-component system, OmpR family, response regulator